MDFHKKLGVPDYEFRVVLGGTIVDGCRPPRQENRPGEPGLAMTFSDYIVRHYVTACKLQRKISRDPQMISMLRDSPCNYDSELVTAWMRDYGLFQGITNQNRAAIVQQFYNFVEAHDQITNEIDDEQIETFYRELFSVFFRTVQRSWMSATSKLLWCLYPNTVVIYDAFVHRTLSVMQCLDASLAGFHRIGESPSVRREGDIESAVRHYMNYQAMVRSLVNTHSQLLQNLRTQYDESYSYDVRIMDKLLWMIGNLREAF